MPERFAFDKSAPVRFAVEKSRPERLRPERSRFDGTSGWYHEARSTGSDGADSPLPFVADTVIVYTRLSCGRPVIAQRVFEPIVVHV